MRSPKKEGPGVSELLSMPRPEPPRSTAASEAEDLRSKMLHRGPEMLSNTELLAVIMGTRRQSESALLVAGRILRRHGLEGLTVLKLTDWRSESGLSVGSACRLAAVIEIHRRLRREEDHDAPKLSTPAEVWRHVSELRSARKEHLLGLYLDAQNRLLAKETLSVGSLNTTRTHPREILEPALRHLALGFILVHNHPSGAVDPSQDDVEFTKGVARAAALMDIGFYDHLVVTAKGYVSMRERRLM